MEEIIPFVIETIEQHGYSIVFLGTIIGGEIVILAAVFLAALGMLNIYLVIILGMLGVVISDSFWYFIGTRIKGRLNQSTKTFFPKRYQYRIELFKDRFVEHYAKFLVASKFVYGTRIVTLITSGYQKIPYRKFLMFNFIGSMIWIVIIVFLGYIMGFSWNYLAKYNEYSKYYVIFGILILFMLRYIFKKIIRIIDE